MRRRDNIVLIGFMGSGKSRVGKALADAMQMEYLDLDDRIEKIQGKKIARIFKDEGRGAFRRMEFEELRALEKTNHTVVATGGGIVVLRENHKPLRDLGPVIWLKARAETIMHRIGNTDKRPLFPKENPAESVRKMLETRDPLYRQVADGIIETDDLPIDVVVRRVIKFLDAWEG